MEGGPLADDLAPGARINQLICGDAGKLVGRGVADTVTAGLNGVHLDFGQVGQNVRHIFQCGPVELHVLTGTEMHVALVVLTGNQGQLAHLSGRNQAVGDGNAQHRRVALYIQAVLQTQRQEFALAQLASEKAAGLIAELLYAVLDDLLIIFVVDIHTETCSWGTAGPFFSHDPSGLGGQTIAVFEYAQKECLSICLDRFCTQKAALRGWLEWS